MNLNFKINTVTKGTSLSISFDDNDTMNGRQGKLLALEHLIKSVAYNEPFTSEVLDFINVELNRKYEGME